MDECLPTESESTGNGEDLTTRVADLTEHGDFAAATAGYEPARARALDWDWILVHVEVLARNGLSIVPLPDLRQKILC